MTLRVLTLGRSRAAAQRRLLDYLLLTKPRVVVMVLVTTLVGFYLASGGPIDPWHILRALIGTGLAAGGALALNQYLERDVDCRMERTRLRPLPDGRLPAGEALLFGCLLVLLGVGCLALLVNATSAAVTATTAVSYLFAYTPLKRRSSLCTVLGAIPGALPPVTGWVAARGEFGVGAWVLFGILFLWQFPHTLAIASVYRRDYARADLQMLPVIEPDGRSTGRQAVATCLALLAMGVLPSLIGLTGWIYFLGAVCLGGGMLACAVALAAVHSPVNARRLVYASLIYLPALFALMAFDKLPL
jgi:protoheme IX farnesyltransferase